MSKKFSDEFKKGIVYLDKQDNLGIPDGPYSSTDTGSSGGDPEPVTTFTSVVFYEDGTGLITANTSTPFTWNDSGDLTGTDYTWNITLTSETIDDHGDSDNDHTAYSEGGSGGSGGWSQVTEGNTINGSFNGGNNGSNVVFGFRVYLSGNFSENQGEGETTITSVIDITITTDDGLDQSKSKNGLTLEAHINVS